MINRYTIEDFNTFYAKERAMELLKEIDWDILDQFQGTDINEKIAQAHESLSPEDQKRIFDDGLPPTHPPLLLSNGHRVDSNTIFRFGLHYQHVTTLRAMKVLEEEFSRQGNRTEQAHRLNMRQTVAQEEYSLDPVNLSLAVRMFPGEATQIFFQFMYAGSMRVGHSYHAITTFIDERLDTHPSLKKHGPVIPSLSAAQGAELIHPAWQQLKAAIDWTVMPQLLSPTGPGQKGPPMH